MTQSGHERLRIAAVGGPFGMKLKERAPERVVAAVLSQPVGHRPKQPDYMYNSGKDVWAKEFRERQPDVSMAIMTALAATVFCSPGSKALAQQTSPSSVTLLCKTSLGGSGFVFVTLSNLTTATIPKGQTFFAKTGNERIKFEAAEAIPENGSMTYRTSATAFQEAGDCTGWY